MEREEGREGRGRGAGGDRGIGEGREEGRRRVANRG